MTSVDFGLLIIRLFFGISLAYHGYNKIFGGGGLTGTAGWFGSLGMKAPKLQARGAALTEIVAGLMFAAGFLTPLAAAAMIGLMVVAIVTVHWKVGFFIFLPDGGWEYCASILVTAWGVAAVGPGGASLDNAWSIDLGNNWAALTPIIGIGGAIVHLLAFYRPMKKS
jgi:putative oxidoreductase